TATYDPTVGTNDGRLVAIGAGGGVIDTNGFTFTTNDGNQLSGSGTVRKIGAGTWVIGQATVGYAGFTGRLAVEQGHVEILNSQSLGTSIDVADGVIVVGGTLDVRVGFTKHVTVEGGIVGAAGGTGTFFSSMLVNGPGTLGSNGTSIFNGNTLLNTSDVT